MTGGVLAVMTRAANQIDPPVVGRAPVKDEPLAVPVSGDELDDAHAAAKELRDAAQSVIDTYEPSYKQLERLETAILRFDGTASAAPDVRGGA